MVQFDALLEPPPQPHPLPQLPEPPIELSCVKSIPLQEPEVGALRVQWTLSPELAPQLIGPFEYPSLEVSAQLWKVHPVPLSVQWPEMFRPPPPQI